MTSSTAVGTLAAGSVAGHRPDAAAVAGPRRQAVVVRGVQQAGHAGQWLPMFQGPGR
jgi:hypothetical protein